MTNDDGRSPEGETGWGAGRAHREKDRERDTDRMSDHVHVTWHQHHVRRQEREALNGHRGCVVWFTGLSGCGKSTVANVVDHKLHQLGLHSFLLDGDNIRHGLNASPELLAEQGESFARGSDSAFPPTIAVRTFAASRPWPSCLRPRD